MKNILQLFSMNSMAEKEGLEKTLKSAAEIGFDGIEFAGYCNGYYGLNAEETLECMQSCGLSAYGAHIVSELFSEENIAETIAFHKKLGCKTLTVPGYRMDGEYFDAFCKLTDRVKPIVEDAGMRFCYHNHTNEFMAEDAYGLYDRLLDRCGIYLQLDSYHIFSAGVNPLDAIDRYKSRTDSVHLRDGNGLKLEPKVLGEGKAPVKEVIRISEKLGLPMIVENACRLPDCVTAAKRCREYLEKNC